MLDYQILSKKKKIIKYNEEYKDLLSDSFNIHKNGSGKMLVVNKYYIARPDLISLAVYGDDRYADIICKLNGISNPFELNKGTILFLPDNNYLINCFMEDDYDDIIRNNDEQLIKKKKSFQKQVYEKRTPNQQIVGDSNFVIDKSNGIIFY